MNEILSLIKAISNKYPTLRLQQIMSIAAYKAGWKDSDLFYCPDDTIMKGLKLMFKENK